MENSLIMSVHNLADEYTIATHGHLAVMTTNLVLA